MSEHLSWETLDDLVDDVIATNVRADVERHLNECEECRQKLLRLTDMLERAADPSEVEAPAGAWGAIRAEIEGKKVVELPVASAAPVRARRYRLAAAAVLLVIASSATTALLMNGRNAPQTVAGTNVTPQFIEPDVLPASLVQMERGYIETVSELTTALEAARDKLAPETVRAVERSLKVIDEAIAEAREALLRDPASELLREMLSKNYQQKVDLLRRASARAQAT